MSNVEPESISPHEFAEHVASFLTDAEVDQPDQETDTATTAPAELEGDTTDTEPELVLDAQGNLHDPETGKFVRKATDEEIASVEEGEEEEEVEEERDDEPLADGEFELVIDDPDVEAFLAKYDGDLNKALKGAVEASRTLGRQGSELGELRKLQGTVEELRGLVEQSANRPAPQPYVDYASLIENDPKQAAQVAMKHGNVDAMMAAVSAWADSDEPRDAFEAATFLNNVMRGYEMDQLREEFKANAAPAVQAASSNEEQEIAKVLTKHPDLEKFLPAIGQIAQERPFLKQALEAGTPEQKATALEDLYLLARSRQDPADTSEAIRKIRVRTAEESKKAKADAAVVSASRGSAASGDQPTRVDSFLDAFDSTLRSRGLMADDE